MHFEKSYFNEETRSDFLIPSDMKHAWAAQLEILSDITDVCKTLGISYFAFWGTMLGAVRHKGFIPWDDDIDIAMKRPDFELFKAKAPELLDDVYVVNTLYTEDPDRRRDDHLMRVNNGEMIRFDEPFLRKFHGFPYVTGIDILALDFLPPNPEEEEAMRGLIKSITLIRESIRSLGFIPKEFSQELQLISSVAGRELPTDTDTLYRDLLKLTDQLFMSYTEEESSEITTYARNMIHPTFRFPKECFSSSVMMPFENFSVPVAKEYDAVLRTQFGPGYMTPRYWASHDYPFYAPQQEQIRDLLGYIPKLTVFD